VEVDRHALEIIFRTNGERFKEYPFSDHYYPRKTPNYPIFLEWKGETEPTEYDFETVDEVFTAVLRDTMDDYHDSKMGVMLSGGIDSAFLLHLAKREYPNRKIVAYHSDWGPSFPAGVELPGARRTTDFVDLPLRVIDSSTKAQLPYIEDALRSTLSINYSATMFYMAFKACNEDGIDVAMTADGIDSFFGGHRFHKLYYLRSRYKIVPFIQKLLRYEPYIVASKLFGVDKAWFVSMISREPRNLVEDSGFEFSQLFEKVKGETLWDLIQNWGAANVSYDSFVAARASWPNEVEIEFPFMRQELLDLAGTFSKRDNANKNIIRKYMKDLGFPNSIVEVGINWDKKGWGGASLPYFDPKYLSRIMPRKTDPAYWLTHRGLEIWDKMRYTKASAGILMALFMKIMELVEE
jgi:asparagine synthetase B (glutamine-hydrolysing)